MDDILRKKNANSERKIGKHGKRQRNTIIFDKQQTHPSKHKTFV